MARHLKIGGSGFVRHCSFSTSLLQMNPCKDTYYVVSHRFTPLSLKKVNKNSETHFAFYCTVLRTLHKTFNLDGAATSTQSIQCPPNLINQSSRKPSAPMSMCILWRFAIFASRMDHIFCRASVRTSTELTPISHKS
jgi:hypothetical protein